VSSKNETRIYTEIRISHQSLEQKIAFEESLDEQCKTLFGYSNRAEYIRLIHRLNLSTQIINKLNDKVDESKIENHPLVKGLSNYVIEKIKEDGKEKDVLNGKIKGIAVTGYNPIEIRYITHIIHGGS
jgi:hypothetical protein